jgi:transcriptional regulator with XRE-family HTH domain
MTTSTAEAEASAIEIRGIDELIGERVHHLMWRRRLSQKALGTVLGIGQSGVSKKLRGQSTWSVADLYAAASLLGVEPGDLLPRLDSNQQPSGYPNDEASDATVIDFRTYRELDETTERAA